MKKPTLTLLALLALTLAGCEEPTQDQIDASFALDITEINYKGHKYLLYRSVRDRGGYGGLTHDPDCPCHKKGGER